MSWNSFDWSQKNVVPFESIWKIWSEKRMSKNMSNIIHFWGDTKGEEDLIKVPNYELLYSFQVRNCIRHLVCLSQHVDDKMLLSIWFNVPQSFQGRDRCHFTPTTKFNSIISGTYVLDYKHACKTFGINELSIFIYTGV